MPQVPPALIKLWGRTLPLPLQQVGPSAFHKEVSAYFCLLSLSLWGLVCVFEDLLDQKGTLIQHGIVTISDSLYMPIFKARAFFEALGGYEFGGYYLPHSLGESEAEDLGPTLCSWPKHWLFLHTQSVKQLFTHS